MQDIPGPPYNLQFTEITMTSLRVSWEPPKLRNGEIIGYIVTYETAEQNDRKQINISIILNCGSSCKNLILLFQWIFSRKSLIFQLYHKLQYILHYVCMNIIVYKWT